MADGPLDRADRHARHQERRDRLRPRPAARARRAAVVIDTGILGEPAGSRPTSRTPRWPPRPGDELDGRARGRLARRGGRAHARRACARSACGCYAEGRLDGALCLGGAEGGLMGAGAMHALPVGVPKLIVTPSASGRREFGPFMGETDTMVMHSVVDILGLHPISRAIFDNAAAAVGGHGARRRRRGRRPRRAHRRRDDARPDHAGRDAAARAPARRRARAGDLPRQRRRRPGDGEARRAAGALAGVDRLHALRARQLADGRRPRDRARSGCGRRPPRPAAGDRPGLLRLLQPGRARTPCPSASATARATSTTRSRRSCGSPSRRASSSAG